MKDERHFFLLIKRACMDAQVEGLTAAIAEIDKELLGDRPKNAGRAAGGAAGGRARADKLTPERRREIAIKAAETRWGKNEA